MKLYKLLISIFMLLLGCLWVSTPIINKFIDSYYDCKKYKIKLEYEYKHYLKNRILTRKIDFLKNNFSGLRITIPSNSSSFKKLFEVSKLY